MEKPDKYDSLYIMISPTTRCNLSCKYCYVNQNMPRSYTDMSIDDINYIYKWVKDYSELVNIKRIQLEWFGGEPLVMGGIFIGKAIDNQSKCFSPDTYEIHNSIQTNLILADKEENIQLIKNHFHSYISGSMDYRGGFRIMKNGKDSTPIVLKNIQHLQDNGISVGLVCTLTKSNIDYIDELYDYFKLHHIDFRVNRAAHVENPEIQSSVISTEEYSKAVMHLFKRYANDNDPGIRFANFDMMVRLYLMGLSDICVTVTKPHLHLAFEANGRLFSRCRFVKQIGNYQIENPQDILMRFRDMTTSRVSPQACSSCSFFNKTCMGGCFGERERDCFHSDCGYRGETNKELWEFLDNFLTEQGYEFGAYRKS